LYNVIKNITHKIQRFIGSKQRVNNI